MIAVPLSPILPAHHAAILRNNLEFVYWLSPLDNPALTDLLGHADYAQQLNAGEAVLIAYDGHGPYRHKNVDWLSARLDNYMYIDRVVIGAAAQGQGAGRRLYADLEIAAQARGHTHIACEVNTQPDNPGSHAFHKALGYEAIGDVDYPNGVSVRYYVRKLPSGTEKPLAPCDLPA
jgi:predicted GNAT superfamily acetyltransferase